MNPALDPNRTTFGKFKNLPPSQRNPGTGYVGFQPASTPRAARARRAGKLAAQTNAKVKFGGK